jgi:nicotinamide-nucleotide amidase
MSTERNVPIEVAVGNLLRAQKKTISIAESCTGGLVTHRITNIPGSSEYLMAGVVAYAYEAKVIALGARGARERFGSTIGMSITGIAGPGGGMPGKPVGLTYIAVVDDKDELVERFIWDRDRIGNKEESAQAALEILQKFLEAHGGSAQIGAVPAPQVGC